MDAVQGPKCHQDNFSPHLQHSSSPQSWKMLSVSQLSGLFNTGEPWLFPRNISRVCAHVHLPVLGGVSHSVHQRGLCALVLLPHG